MNFVKTGEGIYVVNKPVGMTSFGVVHRVRKALGIKRVGHAGTLDPFASGVLVVAAGRVFTRTLGQWQAKPKTYVATMILGKTTETLDIDGQHITIDPQFSEKSGSIANQINNPDFWVAWQGNQMQTPPAFSAKKVGGRRAYQLARKNERVELAPVPITIFEACLMSLTHHADSIEVVFSVTCSKGTYIRQLAADIAAQLGTCAYLSQLVRTAIGEATLEHAQALTDFQRVVNPT